MKGARAWVGHLLAHLPLALSGEDPDGVHQVRVAGRRLRAYLDLLGFRVLKEDLRLLVREAGWVRDLEVALGRDLPQGFREHLEAEREAAKARALAQLGLPPLRAKGARSKGVLGGGLIPPHAGLRQHGGPGGRFPGGFSKLAERRKQEGRV